jgi:hypothetical protein
MEYDLRNIVKQGKTSQQRDPKDPRTSALDIKSII